MPLTDQDFVTPYFKAFGLQHGLALAAIVAVSGSAFYAAGRMQEKMRVALSVLMGVALSALESWWLLEQFQRAERWQDALPMHLCDISLVMVIVALVTRWVWSFEFAYFFGLGGTLQALATPDLVEGFPTAAYLMFFFGHGAIVVAVLFLMGAFGLRPVPRSILRVLGMGYIWFVAAALVNWLLGTNFGYQCHKPAHASLMDKLGPWPWYLLWMQVLAIANILILYLPFYLADRRRSRTVANAGAGP